MTFVQWTSRLCGVGAQTKVEQFCCCCGGEARRNKLLLFTIGLWHSDKLDLQQSFKLLCVTLRPFPLLESLFLWGGGLWWRVGGISYAGRMWVCWRAFAQRKCPTLSWGQQWLPGGFFSPSYFVPKWLKLRQLFQHRLAHSFLYIDCLIYI